MVARWEDRRVGPRCLRTEGHGVTVGLRGALGISAVLVVLGGCAAAPPSVHPSSTAKASATRAAVTVQSGSARRHLWQALAARPLHIPHIAHGTSCPVTRRWTPPSMANLPAIYTPRRRLGTGPAFPGIYTATDPWLQTTTAKLSRIRDPDIPLPRDWLIAKVLWMMQRGYNDPLIVRGHQVDGRGEMRFYQPVRASSRSGNEVRLIGNRQGPSNFAVPGPGCYAWQLDGKGVSKVLVFRVAEARR